MYYKGEGTLKNLTKSFQWYKKSAEQENSNAQYYLGLAYYNGEGVKISKRNASYWIKKAHKNAFDKAKVFWEEKELWKYE